MSFTPTEVRNLLLSDYEPSPRPEEGIQEFVQHYAMMEVLTLHANEPDYLDEFVVTFTRGSHVAILDTRPSESYTDYYGVCLGKGFGKRFSSDDHKDHVNILLYLDDEHDIAVTLQRRRLLTFMEKKISWSWETVVRAIGTACAIMDATDCVDRKVVHKDKPLPDIGFVYDYEMSLKEFSEYVLFLPEYMCSNCGCEKVGMGKCSACSFAYFCCEECQIKHSHTHRQVCKGAALTSNVNEDGVFMLGLDEAAMSKIASRSRSLQGLVNYVMQTDEFDPYTKLHDVLSDCTRI